MSRNSQFVSVAHAYNQTEAIRVKMLLDRTGIPYQVRGEMINTVFFAGTSAIGPMDFLVPQELYDQARKALEDLFDIHPDEIPERCPACDTPTQRGKLECPNCGLYLA